MDSIRIDIRQSQISVKSGVAKQTGKPYCFYSQVGFISGAGFSPEGVRAVVSLEDENPLPVGVYRIDPASLYLDQWGNVKFFLKLAPVHSAVPPTVVQADHIPF